MKSQTFFISYHFLFLNIFISYITSNNTNNTILQKLQPKTQLIAHDKEVYDIAFACGKDVFGTVGADGSLRMFDLRYVRVSVCV